MRARAMAFVQVKELVLITNGVIKHARNLASALSMRIALISQTTVHDLSATAIKQNYLRLLFICTSSGLELRTTRACATLDIGESSASMDWAHMSQWTCQRKNLDRRTHLHQANL